VHIVASWELRLLLGGRLIPAIIRLCYMSLTHLLLSVCLFTLSPTTLLAQTRRGAVTLYCAFTLQLRVNTLSESLLSCFAPSSRCFPSSPSLPRGIFDLTWSRCCPVSHLLFAASLTYRHTPPLVAASLRLTVPEIPPKYFLELSKGEQIV
jgi:hypothetical protein